jgi:hypothetical protein
MSEALVTQYWMFGVMGVMIVFGVFAAIGSMRKEGDSKKR